MPIVKMPDNKVSNFIKTVLTGKRSPKMSNDMETMMKKKKMMMGMKGEGMKEGVKGKKKGRLAKRLSKKKEY